MQSTISYAELALLRAEYDRKNNLCSFPSANEEESFGSNLTLPNQPTTSRHPSTVHSPPPNQLVGPQVTSPLYSSTSILVPSSNQPARNSAEDSNPQSPGIPEGEDEAPSSWNTLAGSETRIRAMSDLQISDEELLSIFKNTESLEEQGDILHFLAYNKGLNWNTNFVGQPEKGDNEAIAEGVDGLDSKAAEQITVKDLLKEVYERACHFRKWALVRHIAGILGKRVEDLAKAVTDLLVRQKQVTVGMPPHNEHAITRPLPSQEIRQIINQAHGGDQSTAMLTQELLVYLAMFIRTEPNLFFEMLRLRVGLIIQVMASELGRALKCSGEEASEHLLNLSPYEMKTLLHHILSGKEFCVKAGYKHGHVSLASEKLSRKSNLDTFIGRHPVTKATF